MKDRCDYALNFIGIPYIYGGNSPIEGLDCSGLVLEALRCEGHVHKEDMTAKDLYRFLKSKNWYNVQREKVTEGDIIFFGNSLDNISHVAIALNNYQLLEAGGGDASTISRAEAIKKNAFVRIRPISNRQDLIAILGHE